MDNEHEDDEGQFNYQTLVENALRLVIREALKTAEKDGLTGDNHFYITFMTTYDGVQISDNLHHHHPEQMTIILQHRFWNLEVRDDDFSVTLSFNGHQESLVIPFMAVLDFNDPSVGFGLQFTIEQDNRTFFPDQVLDDETNIEDSPPKNNSESNSGANNGAKIVSLDQFRREH